MVARDLSRRRINDEVQLRLRQSPRPPAGGKVGGLLNLPRAGSSATI